MPKFKNADRTSRGHEAGFTMIETAIAMVIMVAVLASASLFASSIKNNSGANDRQMAMAAAQQVMEQLRNVAFTDPSLDATGGVTTTLTRANRQYTVVKTITYSNVISGEPTLKTITIQVTPVGTNLGPVSLRTQRVTILEGPYS